MFGWSSCAAASASLRNRWTSAALASGPARICLSATSRFRRGDGRGRRRPSPPRPAPRARRKHRIPPGSAGAARALAEVRVPRPPGPPGRRRAAAGPAGPSRRGRRRTAPGRRPATGWASRSSCRSGSRPACRGFEVGVDEIVQRVVGGGSSVRRGIGHPPGRSLRAALMSPRCSRPLTALGLDRAAPRSRPGASRAGSGAPSPRAGRPGRAARASARPPAPRCVGPLAGRRLVRRQPLLQPLGRLLQGSLQRPLTVHIPLVAAEVARGAGQFPGQDLPEPDDLLGLGLAAEPSPPRCASSSVACTTSDGSSFERRRGSSWRRASRRRYSR